MIQKRHKKTAIQRNHRGCICRITDEVESKIIILLYCTLGKTKDELSNFRNMT